VAENQVGLKALI